MIVSNSVERKVLDKRALMIGLFVGMRMNWTFMNYGMSVAEKPIVDQNCRDLNMTPLSDEEYKDLSDYLDYVEQLAVKKNSEISSKQPSHCYCSNNEEGKYRGCTCACHGIRVD